MTNAMTSAMTSAWTRFWEPEVPAERLALVRILLAGYVMVDLVLYRTWISAAAAPDLFHTPYGPLGWLGAPRLGTAPLALLWLAALGAALLATLGWRTKLTLPVLFLTYGWWVLEHYSYGKPMHARTTLVTALAALALSPCGEALAWRARRSTRPGRAVTGWPIEVIAVSLTYLYLTAGAAKLRFVGLDWWHGGATQAGIALFGPEWSRRLAVDHPGLIDGLALAALLVELAAPVLLWRWRPRWIYAAVAFAFHLAVLAMMHVDFLPMAVACLALLPLERGLSLVRGWTLPSRQPVGVP